MTITSADGCILSLRSFGIEVPEHIETPKQLFEYIEELGRVKTDGKNQ